MNDEFLNKYLAEMGGLIVEKIKALQTGWEKPWITSRNLNYFPQNIGGRLYNGGNAFMLFLWCEKYNYQTPVFLTFKQAKDNGLTILKGAKSLPVYHYVMLVFEKGTGRKIKWEDYKEMSREQQEKYTTIPSVQFYRVFNLDQTDFADAKPQKWETLKARFAPQEIPERPAGDYRNERLDKMLELSQWVCPVKLAETGNRAFFAPCEDRIEIPVKKRFKTPEAFYCTLLHEMAHSTGAKNRLDRLKPAPFGSPQYGREELVAELSGALSGVFLGVFPALQENNLAYLKSWIETINEQPKFLLSVLGDTAKAVKYITDHLKVEAPEIAEAA